MTSLEAGMWLFLANLVFIACKAWQQRNVQYLKYFSTLVGSHVLAAVEIYVIAVVAERGLSVETYFPIALGGGLGAVLAMYLTRGYKHGR